MKKISKIYFKIIIILISRRAQNPGFKSALENFWILVQFLPFGLGAKKILGHIWFLRVPMVSNSQNPVFDQNMGFHIKCFVSLLWHFKGLNRCFSNQKNCLSYPVQMGHWPGVETDLKNEKKDKRFWKPKFL